MWGVQGWPMWTLGWSVCSEPAAKRQPGTDENPYNWPKPAHMAWSSSTLHCQWEWRIQAEKVKQRKRADLTEDAAPYWALWKDVVCVYQILSNEAAHLTWIMLRWVFYAESITPSRPWKLSQEIVSLTFFLFILHLLFFFLSFQHNFSYPSWSMHCSIPSFSLCVYVCVYGAPLHVGLLSPSHTSGAGSGTEHPEGPNFPRLPNPSLLSLFLRLLAIQEYASQVLGNLHAALLPSSTYSLIPPSLSAHPFPLSLFLFLFSLTFSLHLSVPHFCLHVTLPAPLLSGLWQPL